MKRSLATLALTCALSGSAMAGDIPTCGLMAEEPTTETEGSIPTGDLENPLVEMVLAVISLAY